MALRTEHLDVVLRSLRAVYQPIEFESASPAFASWRAAGVLIDLAEEASLPPSESAACLAVSCDLLAFAEKSVVLEPSSVLSVTLSSAIEFLGIYQLADQVEGQQAEHTMAINLALLEFGVMEDADARFMTGALRGIVARSAPVVVWAAASLIVRREASLRKWLVACQSHELSTKETSESP